MIARQNGPSVFQLVEALREARERTLELIADLSDEQLMGPRLSILNPLRWEIGHVAWFQEFWLLRHLRRETPILSHGDSLYDSARVAHDTRWDIPLLSRADTLTYVQEVLNRVVDRSRRQETRKDNDGYDETYFLHLVLFHECMHAEAFTYTRQTLAYPPPRLSISAAGSMSSRSENASSEAGEARSSLASMGDAYIPGGTYTLGSSSDSPFVFDNEQRAHEVEVRPFSISKTAVSNSEFATFVSEGGYRRREFWSEQGWCWRESVSAEHPVYWESQPGSGWLRRNFDEVIPLEERHPVLHVNWHEADAYCRWAGRRLPTEAEWETAASAEPGGDQINGRKRMYTWGGELPTPDLANLDWRAMGTLEVDALPAGDSAFGCRQMIGNVWEWTSTDFEPYEGFAPGPYKEYSQPWFGDHKVLRGGCWATRSSLIRNMYRNFYKPDRRDVWAGFRTCALWKE